MTTTLLFSNMKLLSISSLQFHMTDGNLYHGIDIYLLRLLSALHLSKYELDENCLLAWHVNSYGRTSATRL